LTKLQSNQKNDSFLLFVIFTIATYNLIDI